MTARALWLYLFISPSSPAHSVAPSSEFRNDIPLARQACQVVSCAIVGCVINGDGQQLLPPFSSPLGATAGLKYVTVFVAGFEILRRCKKILVNFSLAMFSLFFFFFFLTWCHICYFSETLVINIMHANVTVIHIRIYQVYYGGMVLYCKIVIDHRFFLPHHSLPSIGVFLFP